MRTGRTQKGRFDIHPGMCFIMHDMDDLASCGLEQMPGNHPWLVTSVDDDYVEIVMCSTLISDNEDKYRLYSLEYENVTDISNGCPPMDEYRMSKVSMDTFMLLPKKELFSHSLRLLNNNTANCNFTTHGMESLCLCETSLNGIRKDINQYLADHPEYDYDPFQCIASSDYMCSWKMMRLWTFLPDSQRKHMKRPLAGKISKKPISRPFTRKKLSFIHMKHAMNTW